MKAHYWKLIFLVYYILWQYNIVWKFKFPAITKTEAVQFSETLVPLEQVSYYHNPEAWTCDCVQNNLLCFIVLYLTRSKATVDGFIYTAFISLQAILLTIYCNMAGKKKGNKN
jgi:hypothetical protein